MRTRALGWFLLAGLWAPGCKPAPTQRPPAARPDAAAPATAPPAPTAAPDAAPAPAADASAPAPATDGAPGGPGAPPPAPGPAGPSDAGNVPVPPPQHAGTAPVGPDTGCVPRGPENTAAACANRVDDDCDRQADCADLDCAGTPGCRAAGAPPPPPPTANCAPRGPENTAAACANRVDDDCDGQADCADNDCLRVRGAGCEADAGPPPPTANCAPRGPENTAAACGNRADDDCDGQVDCADNDCVPPAAPACPQRPPPAPTQRPPAAQPAAPAQPAQRPAAPAQR